MQWNKEFTGVFKVFARWMYLETERRGVGKVKYSFYFPKGVDDALHMANHVSESCKREYPKVIKEVREHFDSKHLFDWENFKKC